MDDELSLYLTKLEAAYEFAYRTRLTQLNGGRPHEWRSDGLHHWSHLWGQIDVATPPWLLDLMAEAPKQLSAGPAALRAAADADAHDEFIRRIKETR